MTFLGDAAQIAARVEDGFAVIGEQHTRIAVPAANGAVTLCCRPWDIRLVALAEADAVGTIQAVRRLGGSSAGWGAATCSAQRTPPAADKLASRRIG